MTVRIHLDTDLGGDPDDACALTMLLGWPDVEVVGITSVIDPGGLRAGCITHCLRLAGRDDIPVAAGAVRSLTTLRVAHPATDDERYWPGGLEAVPSRPGAALDLIDRGLGRGATVVGIGPCTNLALMEIARPGSLSRAPVVLMGGWIEPPADGLPQWGPDMDWNVQWDTRAASIVAASADVTLVTLAATLKAQLRRADLPRLRASGPLGELLARQTLARAADAGMPEIGRANAALPDDLLNFHYDPVACAVAVGWPGATIEAMRLRPALGGEVLRFERSDDGRLAHVVVDVEGALFANDWISAVEAAQR